MHQPSEALFSSKVDYCLFVYKTPQAVGTILETAFVGHTVLPLQNVFSLELYRNIYRRIRDSSQPLVTWWRRPQSVNTGSE